jgi:transposase
LTKQVERDILPVLAALADMGCSHDDVQLLVWEFPRIFVSSNWRRHVRKFQVGRSEWAAASQHGTSMAWLLFQAVHMFMLTTDVTVAVLLCCST